MFDVFDTTDEFAVGGIPERDFVIAADRQFRPRRCERQGRHRHGRAIGLGRVRMRLARDEAHQVGGLRRAVELSSRCNPTSEQVDLLGRNRIAVLWHPLVFVGRRNQAEQFAVVGLAGNDRIGRTGAGRQQLLERLKLVVPLGVGCTVASQAVLHQDRRDVVLEADIA